MKNLDTLTPDLLKRLAEDRCMPSVSIYLPTSKAGRETLQSPIQLKNLVSTVEQELMASGSSSDKIDALLGPVRDLLTASDFWQHQDHGLCLFITPSNVRMYSLPYTVSPRVYVGETFDLVPALAILKETSFSVLALSENQVRLFSADQYGMSEVEIEQMPANMADTSLAIDTERQQQRHGGASGPPTYFGSGSGSESSDQDKELKRFFSSIDAAASGYFQENRAPLLLAGVQHLLPIYRSANTAAEIWDAEVHGNKDRTSIEELHAQSWCIAAPYFEHTQEEIKETFHQMMSAGKAAKGLKEAEKAAEAGRIQALFASNQADSSPEINRVVSLTLSKSGNIYSLPEAEMPTTEAIAATFRY